MGHKYVCLRCRKCFSAGTDFIKIQDHKKCPDCLAPMVLLNEKFKAPSINDVARWEVVKMLVDNGFRYQTIYDPISGERIPYPTTKTEAEEFIRNNQSSIVKRGPNVIILACAPHPERP